VHSGFLKLYQDIAKDLTETLQAEIRNQSPQELIITGHSMGGSVSYLLCMDLLEKHSEILPAKVCLATYGAPRTGNSALVQHYRTLVEAFKSKEGSTFEEYSIKAYNDGMSSVKRRKRRT
jgi:surfactin synthase thioesterase subunit